MDTGRWIKQTISKNNKAQRENKLFNNADTPAIASEARVEKLKLILLYNHLQGHYFLIRAYCLMCFSLYIAWVVGNGPLD